MGAQCADDLSAGDARLAPSFLSCDATHDPALEMVASQQVIFLGLRDAAMTFMQCGLAQRLLCDCEIHSVNM